MGAAAGAKELKTTSSPKAGLVPGGICARRLQRQRLAKGSSPAANCLGIHRDFLGECDGFVEGERSPCVYAAAHSASFRVDRRFLTVAA